MVKRHKLQVKYLFGAICLCIIALLCISVIGHADSASTWLASGQLLLQKDADLSASVLAPFSFNGNRDCNQYTFVTRPGRLLPVPQTQISHVACGVQTHFGVMDSDGYLSVNNSGVSGKAFKFEDINTKVIPIPGSNMVLHYSSAPSGGLYLFFTLNAPASLIPAINAVTGEVSYAFNHPDDASLRDKSGKLLPAQIESMSFSTNGQWMVVDVPLAGSMIRVNLQTLEVLPFAPAFNYSIGLTPSAQTAISSDGRYAAVASQTFGTFKVYDLSTCTNIPSGAIVNPASCQSHDIWSFMQDQVSGFRGVNTLRFVSNNILSLYASYRPTPTGINLVSKYLLAAPGQTIQHSQYMGLGDSFASGEGARVYADGTDTGNNKCHLSELSYPFLISNELNFNSYHSVACSGAKIKDIIELSDDEYKKNPQASGKENPSFDNEIYSNFLPGYRAQLNFVKNTRPQIITLSTIGNDIGFTHILKSCLGAGTCYSSYEDRLELVRQINSKFDSLAAMLAQVKNTAPATAQIYVIAYPQLAYPGGNCGVNVHLNASELEFSTQLISYLNSMVKNASQNAGVDFIDIEDALASHRLCETSSNQTAVNGLTAGNDSSIGPLDSIGPFGQESFHPNALGHRLMAQAILNKTNQMTLGQPLPNSSITAPAEINQPILNAPKTNRPVNLTSYNDALTSNTLQRSNPITANVDGLQFSLKPLASYHATINAGQIDLGNFITEATGNLSFQTPLPDLAQTGFNNIDISGKNLAGEPINISKTVYIASPADTGCPSQFQINQDIDQDGMDDGCDGTINAPPPVTTSPAPVDQPPANDPPAPIVPPTEPPIDTTPPQQPPADLPIDTTPPADSPLEVTPPQTQNPPIVVEPPVDVPPIDVLPPDPSPTIPVEPPAPVDPPDPTPEPIETPPPVQDTTSPQQPAPFNPQDDPSTPEPPAIDDIPPITPTDPPADPDPTPALTTPTPEPPIEDPAQQTPIDNTSPDEQNAPATNTTIPTTQQATTITITSTTTPKPLPPITTNMVPTGTVLGVSTDIPATASPLSKPIPQLATTPKPHPNSHKNHTLIYIAIISLTTALTLSTLLPKHLKPARRL